MEPVRSERGQNFCYDHCNSGSQYASGSQTVGAGPPGEVVLGLFPL